MLYREDQLSRVQQLFQENRIKTIRLYVIKVHGSKVEKMLNKYYLYYLSYLCFWATLSNTQGLLLLCVQKSLLSRGLPGFEPRTVLGSSVEGKHSKAVLSLQPLNKYYQGEKWEEMVLNFLTKLIYISPPILEILPYTLYHLVLCIYCFLISYICCYCADGKLHT